MIEKLRHYTEFSIHDKYQIDKFHNPYLSKLTLKIVPNIHHFNKSSWISPFTIGNRLYIAQSLPLLRNQKIRFTLLWQQNFQQKFTSCQFGFSLDYRVIEEWKAKVRILMGTQCWVSTELHRHLPYQIQALLAYQTIFQKDFHFHMLKCCIKKGGLTLGISNRINLQSNLNIHYNKKIFRDLYLEIRCNSELSNWDSPQIEAGFSYNLTNTQKASALTCFHNDQQKIGIKLQFETQTQKYGNALIGIQYAQMKNVLYLGYKSPSFSLIMPIAIIDSFVPILLAGVVYLCGYFLKKANKLQIKLKSVKERQQQLRLISTKSNQIYQKERVTNGLLIEEAYSGPRNLLEQLKTFEEKGIYINRNAQFKEKVFDVTVSMRFYTQKGELFIPKGQKNSLLGYYNNKHDSLYIIYKIDGITKQQIFDENQKVQIKKLQNLEGQ